MTEAVKNEAGQKIGIIEYMPNGLVYAFSHATKMSITRKTKADAIAKLFGSQYVTVTH